MKKILIIAKSLSLEDGQGRYSIDMINQLKKQYELMVFFKESGKKTREEKNVSYFKINNLFFSWELFRSFKKVDFIHCFSDYPYCLIPFWPWFLNRKPVFITVHGTYGVLPLDRKKSKPLLVRAYKRAKAVFCVSNFTKEQILKRINVKNLIVINNGVNFEKFSKYDKKFDSSKIIISVGALKPRKGYHISIPAIAGTLKGCSGVKYYIVGGEPPKRYLKLVKEYKLEKVVKFFKNLSDEELINLYYKSYLFLLSPIIINENDFEGFGQVYLEAGACGLPAIGTFDCGAEDAIVNGKTGLLVPQNNIKKTTEAILKLLKNPNLTEQMGEMGRRRAREMDWKNKVKEYVKIYEKNLS